MKASLTVTIFCLSVFTAVYAQDCCVSFNEQSVEMYKLQQQHKQDSTSFAQKLHIADDSITNLNKELATQRLNFDRQIASIQQEMLNLQEQLRRLDKNNIRLLEARLQQQSDSIMLMHRLIATSEQRLADMDASCIEREKQQLALGQQMIVTQIANTYKSRTFDDLISTSTAQTVKRDMSLIGNDLSVIQTLLNLQRYFVAQGVLSQRFDSIQIRLAQAELKNITLTGASENLRRLTTRIENYRLRSEAFIATLDKIMRKDAEFLANDDYTKKVKIQAIMNDLGAYIHDYRLNPVDYPFLADVIFDIIKRKHIDANADLSDIRARL